MSERKTPLIFDPVKSPKHYIKNAIVLEPIELVNRLNSSLGQAMKYVIRRHDKNTVLENLEKGAFEMQWFIDNIVVHSSNNVFKPFDPLITESEGAAVVNLFRTKSTDAFTRNVLTALFPYGNGLCFKRSIEHAIKLINQEIRRIKNGGNEKTSEDKTGVTVETNESAYNPFDWNKYPDVKPPIGEMMIVEGDGGAGTYFSRLWFDGTVWKTVDGRTVSGPGRITRFRAWDGF